MLELVIVIVIGAILTTIVMAAFGSVQTRMAVRQSRNAFAALHARTRAQAIEFGTNTSLHIDVAGDSVWITRNGATLETIRFAEEFGVDLTSAASPYELCMSPRGFGDMSCTSFSAQTTVAFEQGQETMYAQMLPMGQLRLPGNR